MMQMTLTFGSTTIDLMDDGNQVLDGFYPAMAMDADESVVETMDVLYRGTAAGGRSLVQSINRMLNIARLGKIGDDRVYVNFAMDGSDTLYRSRVLDGQIKLDERVFKRWKDNRVQFTLRLERLPYWEGAETTLPLTNSNGTDVMTGINVYLSCDDATGSSPNKRDNWVKINDEDVEGDMPAPVKVGLYFPYTISPIAFNHLWMGIYPDLLGDGQLPHNVETFNSTGVTATSDTDASGGSYYAIPITASPTVEAVFNFGTSITMLRKSWVRFFLRTFGPAPDGMWIMVRGINYDGYVVGSTPWVQIVSTSEVSSTDGTRVYDLGLMQMPPMDIVGTFINMVGQVYCYVSGGGTLKLDAIQMMPVDYYAELGRGNRTDALLQDNSGSDVNEHFIFEQFGDEEKSWVQKIQSSPSVFTYEYQFFSERIGNGLYLTPGVDNYVHFIKRAPTSKYNLVSDYGILTMYYRPRRRNI
jgi:hypothetical protein